MEFQKWFLSATTGCLLLGASGAALAEDSTCVGGIINNRTVDNVTVNGTSCFISETKVNGNITVTNSPLFVMTNDRVLGTIAITGAEAGEGSGQVLLYDVNSFNDVSVNGVGLVWFFNNRVVGGDGVAGGEARNVVFENNTDEVEIFNSIVDGNLSCMNNNFVVTEGNIVGGTDTCSAQ